MTFKFFTVLLLSFAFLPLIDAQIDYPDEKKVIFYADDMLLEDALVSLAKKSDVNIAYRNDIIPNNIVITISAKGKPVGQILDAMLSGTDLKYRIVGSQIVIESEEFAYEPEKEVKEKPIPIDYTTYVTISGSITDIDSGESLPYANVYTADNKYGTSSNEYGFYSISVPVSDLQLYCSYIGYSSEVVSQKIDDDTIINLKLKSKSQLNEVLIVDDPFNADETVDNPLQVPVKLLSAMVPLAGESDILKFIQSSPGVSTGADGVGGLSVRGGNVEHNLFLLDGVPVYEVNHALGLFSVFNNYAIKNSQLYKSSFPAKYGGRLASVVDIRTKEGNINKFGGEVGIGSITGKFSIEGPIEKGKSSFIFSARRTLLDPFISSASNAINNQAQGQGDRNYRFYDLFGKVNFKLNPNNRVFFTFFNGNDAFNSDVVSFGEIEGFPVESERIFDFSSTNTLFGLKWNHKVSNSTFLRTNVYYTGYSLDVFELLNLVTFTNSDTVPDIITFDGALFGSQIRDLGLQLDLDRVYPTGNKLSIGLHLVSHNYNPATLLGNELSDFTIAGEVPVRSDFAVQLESDVLQGIEGRLYGQFDLQYGERNVLSFGLNQSVHTGDGDEIYFIPEPRVSLLQMLGNAKFRVSYARLSQFNHRISTTSLGWPLDIWVPTTSGIPPQLSSNVSASLTFPLSEQFEMYIEGYYRTMKNLTTFNAGGVIDISENSNWELLIPQGEGRAYGAEMGIDKSIGKLVAGVNYTLSFSDRQFDLINNGNRFPYRFERRHSFKTSLIYQISDKMEVAANWLFATGNPITVPSRVTIEDDRYKFLYSEINGDRLDPFHRLDFGFNFYNDLDWGKLKFTVGVYNLYNRQNPFYLDVIPRDNDNLRQYSVLPLVPSVSANLQF